VHPALPSKRVAVVVATGFSLLFAPGAGAALDLSKVGQFNSPTYVTSPPEDRKRLFVTERAGKIRVVSEGRKRSKPFLDITGKVGTASEGGLLSMAFAPGYKKNRRFYVYYVDKRQDIRIDEFRTRRNSPTRADKGSRRQVIRIKSPPNTHKGGQLQMTKGGYLLAATGDGGDFRSPSKKPQKRGSLLGKLLRIKPDTGRKGSARNWRPHPDNPYAGKRKGHSAILSLGLRNPWRFSLDRKRPSRIVIGDVGHSRTEEVNLGSLNRLAGTNFGWPCFEGNRKLKSCKVKRHKRPRFTYSHKKGRCSITGGYVNRARGLPRQGEYFYGDFCSGEIRTLSLNRGRSRSTGLNVSALVSFGEDAKGNLYTVSLSGSVSKIVNR
jgi:glucose/arabinose dehydrogenase